VHGDLKPGNILVTAEGGVRLLDFGIARLLGESEGPSQPTDAEPSVELAATTFRALTPTHASPPSLPMYRETVIIEEILNP